MDIVRPSHGYLRELIGAGIDGIAAVRREQAGIFHPPIHTALWPPFALGATAGALGMHLTGKRKASMVALGTALGSLIGIGAALAWTSRRFTGAAVRRATQRVSASRDLLWLRTHPIDYA